DGKPTEVQRSVITNGQVTAIESFLYSYNVGLLSGVTWQQQSNGVLSTIRHVSYTYGSGTFASTADLQFVTVADAAGHPLDTSYYRYYTPSDPGIGTIGYVDGLKYYFDPESYARLVRGLGDPQGLSDSVVAPYATYAFQFDSSSHRVSEVVIQGQGRYDYTYSSSNNPVGFNSWAHKTIELRSGGSKIIAYTNYVGEIMLLSLVNSAGTQAWNTFYRYDGAGRLIMTAEPSAMTIFDDTKAD